MKTITYTFADGSTQTVEVSDELYAAHEQEVQAEKRNHWKNTRRHISLTYLNEYEIDIPDSDCLTVLVKKMALPQGFAASLLITKRR